MNNRWIGAIQIAAVFVGTIVGAGFATGKEIVTFFSQYGLYGFFGILIAGFLFITSSVLLMEKSIQLGVSSYEAFNEFLFGKFIGKLMNICMLLMLLCVCGVMLSGAGAVFQEQLNMSKYFGIAITIILSFITIQFGTKGLVTVNMLVVPMMILFNFILLVTSITTPTFYDHFIALPDRKVFWHALSSPFLYVALNIVLSEAVLVPLAVEVGDRKTVRLGGILGGVCLTLILLSSHLSLIMVPNLLAYDIPIAEMVKHMFSYFYFLYLIIIYGEIFTSIIGNLYGIEKQLQGYFPSSKKLLSFLIITIVCIISLAHYGTLLSYVYPAMGYFSLLFIFLLWGKKVRKHIS